jgi:flagellar secretion chaperone FliS
MATMASISAKRSQYNREAILSATPIRLLTMLYDRLLLDLNRAEAAQDSQDWQVASENLLHAQAIVAELTSSLNADAWDGGQGLLGLYLYVSNALIAANVRRDVARTRESIALLEPLRTAWYEAAGEISTQRAAEAAGGRLDIA